MKIAFFGMGYLGQVYSAWCANMEHAVSTFGKLTDKEKCEPELVELRDRLETKGFLKHVSDTIVDQPSLREAEAVWITFDTPIAANGEADVEFIKKQVWDVSWAVSNETPILISSQIPLGTIADLEARTKRELAYIPENVRVGRGLSYLKYPDRFILGTRNPKRHLPLVDEIINSRATYLPNPTPILVMSPEEAEMVKHAINAFLGTCISFSNEIAAICKARELDVDKIVAGLRTEWRIGGNLPLKPGGPFKTGHIERDMIFLESIASNAGLEIPLLRGVSETNNRIKHDSH